MYNYHKNAISFARLSRFAWLVFRGDFMNPLGIIKDFDSDLFEYFKDELDRQHCSLSFIPEDNTTSPLCASIMGSVLVNTTPRTALHQNVSLENLTAKRICRLFGAEHANVKTITIEAAARIVFQSLSRRGDVVMSLDLRKKEHCNSENLAYRFVNFGIDPVTQHLDMDAIEKQAMECRPQLIVLSPINYPLNIDYEHFARIARACGAMLWCDITQLAGLIAGGVVESALPHADVVTISTHGALQGPLSSIILCKQDLAGVIDRMVITSGHRGLQTAGLAALAARIFEMEDQSYKNYAKAVVENSKAFADGFRQGGIRLVCDGSENHLVMVDAKSCSVSARGAQELLLDAGVTVRICSVLTQDPKIKYDAIRFSTLLPTTRGMTPSQMKSLGHEIAKYLSQPNDGNLKSLKKHVTEIASKLPVIDPKWVAPVVLKNLKAMRPSNSFFYISEEDGGKKH